MIDLSFLTDEEQEAILKVLQRDADLKRAEEERIRHLPEKIKDDSQVKNMSGQWFYEAKSKRHREKINGADIIRASIRRKPLKTEWSQSRSDKTKSSWVNNVNKEVPTPPGPLSVIEEESKSSQSPRVFIATSNTLQKPREDTRKTSVSPSNQRKNPFNDSTLLEDNLKTEQPENRMTGLSERSDQGQKLPLATKEEPQAPKVGSADLEQGSEEGLNPVMEALKRSSNREISSKSLEDIPSATSNEGKVNLPREDLILSAEDDQKVDQPHETHENASGISTAPSFPDNHFTHPEKVKQMSKSVPAFLQDEVSTSVMSVYSGDFGNVDVKGNIQFAIDYVDQLKEFHIFIAQGKDLAIADVKKQRSDPYVKSYLLPEKNKLGKRKTSVKKKTLNPVYNEILRYKVDKELLATQRLNISVWHNDTFGRNSFLGEVELDLRNWDWNEKQNRQMNWYPLKPRTPLTALELENRGEIKIALQYVPQPAGGKKTPATGEVHIWVKECNDLPILRSNKLNSFVKCTILPDTSRKSRQKTRAVPKTTNPVFNHTMVYDGFRPEDLKEACVELTVWDHNKLANHFLGGLRIGLGTGKSYGTPVDWMDSTLDEASLWERMIDTPNTWVEDTLPLRMLTMTMTK